MGEWADVVSGPAAIDVREIEQSGLGPTGMLGGVEGLVGGPNQGGG
jgi:hypothetical protein